MRLYTIFKIAIKNLWLHRFRTILTVTGVTIGIGAIVFLVSLGYGLEQLVTNQVANFNAFTIIDVPSANIKTLRIDTEAVGKIKNFGHIKTVAPVINLAGRVKKAESSTTTETVIVGADKDYWQLSDVYPEKGHMPEGEDEVVVNQAVLNLVGETVDTVIDQKYSLDVIIPKENRTTEADGMKVAEDVKVTVVGVLKDAKSPMVLVPMALMAKNDAVNFSSLKVKVDNKANVEIVRKQLENAGFSSEYVGDTVSEISQVFALFRGILAAFGLIALVVAALGAFNTLTISLMERIREIGLFKALGMRNKDIYKMFIAESILIGVSGGILGLAIGESLGQIVNMVLSALARRAGTDAVTVFTTPWIFAVAVAVFSIVVGFLTGWYPAKRAVKLNPLDALRYE